jgi:hypothetical protein
MAHVLTLTAFESILFIICNNRTSSTETARLGKGVVSSYSNFKFFSLQILSYIIIQRCKTSLTETMAGHNSIFPVAIFEASRTFPTHFEIVVGKDDTDVPTIDASSQVHSLALRSSSLCWRPGSESSSR